MDLGLFLEVKSQVEFVLALSGLGTGFLLHS